MIRVSHPAMSANHPSVHGSDASGDLSIRGIWGLLTRNWKLVAGAVVATMLLAAAYVWTQAPTYLSEATLRVEDEREGNSILTQIAPLGGGRDAIATEIMVLRTYSLSAEVADSLALHVRVAAPAVSRASLFSVVEATPEAIPATYLLERSGESRYRVVVEEGGGGVQVPEQVEVGRPFSVGGVSLALNPRLRRRGPDRIRVVVDPFTDAVDDMRAMLSVSRPHPEAKIVSIRYRSTDPELAATVPNVLTSRFVDYKRRSSKSESASRVRFLRDQVAVYEEQLGGAEVRLRDFREGAQVVSPRDQATEQVRRLAELQATRDQLTTERETLRRLLARVESGPQTADGVSPYRQLAAFPTFLSNLAVQDLLRALIEQENQRSELLRGRQASTPDVQARTQRIQELELQLYQLARDYLGSLNGQLAAIESNLGRFSAEIQAVPSTEIELARLSRQQGLLETIYTLLQTRLKEAEIEQASDPENVRLIDAARLPDRPFSPRPVRMLAIAVVLGGLLGMGASLARETLDTKVRSREDVQAATAGMAILGYIPPIRSSGSVNGRNGRNGKVPHAPEEVLAQRLVARSEPQSPVAEAYRALRTSVAFSSFEKAPQVLVVASAMPGDGKSTTASNLAITLAQQGTRTLIVDADLRKGLLHRVFVAAREPGLTNVLVGTVTLEDAVQRIPAGEGGLTLDFLASGPYPPNPAEALGSEQMGALIEAMRGRYDNVIFDAPPLNLVTDAAVLGKMADATLLVARANATEKGALHHAASQLTTLHASVLGVVINNFDLARAGYYGYGGRYGGS